MSEEKLLLFGVYIHKTKGTFALAYKADEKDKYDWAIDEGKVKKHPFFRTSFPVEYVGTGYYFFNHKLKNFEYLGEL